MISKKGLLSAYYILVKHTLIESLATWLSG
jgi:hypothetical protein